MWPIDSLLHLIDASESSVFLLDEEEAPLEYGYLGSPKVPPSIRDSEVNCPDMYTRYADLI